MIKLLVTGDNHIGRKYDRYPNVKDMLVQTRLDCLWDMVRYAENEKCDAFVITGDERVWRQFVDEMNSSNANIILLNEYTPMHFELGDDEVVIYPAYCDSKHSKENKLGWIKKEVFDKNTINIGIAHGALAGITPDVNEEYFLMTEKELQGISVDACSITGWFGRVQSEPAWSECLVS